LLGQQTHGHEEGSEFEIEAICNGLTVDTSSKRRIALRDGQLYVIGWRETEEGNLGWHKGVRAR